MNIIDLIKAISTDLSSADTFFVDDYREAAFQRLMRARRNVDALLMALVKIPGEKTNTTDES